MKRGIIAVIFFVMTFFAAANDRKSNNQVSDVVSNQITRYSSGSYKPFSLENQFNKIIAGSCLINVATAGTALTAYTFATPLMWGLNYVAGVMSLAILTSAPLAVGIVLLSHGVYKLKKFTPILTDEFKHLFISDAYKRYLRFAMITGIVSGVSFLTVMSGVAMHITAYVNPSELMTYGIIPDIIGGLGLLVCLPMMIAAFAMSAWCKGELAKLSPDIAITHDDKQGYTEGYSVSIGMRVRI